MFSFYRVHVSTPGTIAVPKAPFSYGILSHISGTPRTVLNFLLGEGLSSPQLPCSGICTDASYRSLSTAGQRCAKTPCCTGHRGTEMRASPCRAPQIVAVLLAWFSHSPPSPAHLSEEAGPISLAFWMGKSTANSQHGQASRQQQQQQSINRCGLFLDAKHSSMRHVFWDM